MKATVSVHVTEGDSVRAAFSTANEVSLRHGEPLRVPASIRVFIGDGLDLWGEPKVLLRVLADALARAREAEAAGDQEEVTDLGGMA